MTYDKAVKVADKRAEISGAIQFVVFEAGEYEVANEFDLDTWFAGISDNNIRYCTADRS